MSSLVSQTRTVTEGEISVTACEATLYGTINRLRMYREITDGTSPYLKLAGADETLWMVVQFNWPDLTNGTSEVKGLTWPLDPAEVAALPTRFVNLWRKAIWEVNPDWAPEQEPPKQADEKK